MIRLSAQFVAFDELPLSDLFRSVGVYVIWDARQVARPSYIGEGDILGRFATEHAHRFHAPIQGYAAVLGDDRTKAAREDARILELVLLEIAHQTDRYPTVNTAAHRRTLLDDYLDRYGTLRVSLAGSDPFHPPWKGARSLKGSRITVRTQDSGGGFEHPWHKRRKLRPIGSA